MQSNIRAVAPLFFQKALVEEIKIITEGMRFCSPKGGERVAMNVYNQALPIPFKRTEIEYDNNTIDYQDGEEESIFQCPWCIVKIDGGQIQGINEMQKIDVGICFGIFDDSQENQGHMEILNLIQRVYERFAVNPILAGQYTCQGEFEWALQEEDTYPYFFGAIGTSFQFRGYRRENKFT